MKKFSVIFEYIKTTNKPNSITKIIEAETQQEAEKIIKRLAKKELQEPENISATLDIEEIDTTPQQQSLKLG